MPGKGSTLRRARVSGESIARMLAYLPRQDMAKQSVYSLTCGHGSKEYYSGPLRKEVP